ncbi:MAG: NAD-dependent epimerase/dehydratase family protein [Myxococcota bacterium]
MKVLVTGGMGFTGSALCLRLAEQGHEVVALDNKGGIFDDELRERDVSLHLGSVTDEKLDNQLAEGCAQIHHLAAAFRLVNLGKKAYWDVNVGGTENVLEAARLAGGARVVNCSTCGVHGNVDNPPAGEDAPIAPADYYQYTKWEGEKIAMSRVEAGQWVTTLRPAAIYGPGDPERFLMIFRRVAKGRFVFLGNGSTTYHPLYIDNLVDAFMRAAEVDEANGRSYLIADEEYVPIRDLVERTARALDQECQMVFLPFWPAYAVAAAVELVYKPLPAEPPIFRRRLDWFRQNRAFQIERAKNELGWTPRVGLDQGLRETGAWYREKGLI